MDDAEILRQILVLKASQFVGSVRTTDVDFQGSHSDSSVWMREEIMQHVKDGSFRHDKFLKIFRMEIVAVNVDGRQENGFHLIMTKLVSWLVSSDQYLIKQYIVVVIQHRQLNNLIPHLSRSQGDFGIFRTIEHRQLL